MSRSTLPRRGTYLYGIIRTPDPRQNRVLKVLDNGVGTPPARVRLLPFEEVSAIVSTVDADAIGESAGVRGFMRDMAAHADVLNRVLAVRTVLPSRFGLVFPDDRVLVEEMLAPRHDLLLELLRQLKGAVELRVTAEYVESKVLEEVIRRQPQLTRNAAATYQQRIDVGRRIAGAIAEKRDSDAHWVLDRLARVARDVSVGEAGSELNVLKASFLVDRGDIDRFDQALARVQKQAGDSIRFACVGPLPPYSFADVRIPAGVH
jgi:hypothetical protein